MTDYFIDISQTFNGDGLTSGAATIDGGSGAANDFYEVTKALHATIGQLSGGDNVYVRTANASGDLSLPLDVSQTMSFSTSKFNRLRFYFDDGTVWAESGLFTINWHAVDKVNLVWGSHTDIYAGNELDRRLKFEFNYAEGHIHGAPVSLPVLSTLVGAIFHWKGDGNTCDVGYYGSGDSIQVDCLYKISAYGSYSGYSLFNPPRSSKITFKNPVIDLGDLLVSTNIRQFCGYGSYRSSAEFIGGKVIGNSDVFTILRLSGGTSTFVAYFRDFYLDKSTGVSFFNKDAILDTSNQDNTVIVLGGKNTHDCNYFERNIITDFVYNGSFPYLNATLPDAASTGWSLRVEPFNTKEDYEGTMPVLEKYCDLTATNLTVRLELMQVPTMAIDTHNFWYELVYIDDLTGDPIIASSRQDTANAIPLVDSLAAWQPNQTFGEDAFVAKKIELTTPTAVRKGTIIRLYGKTTLDIADGVFIFVCPDFQVSD